MAFKIRQPEWRRGAAFNAKCAKCGNTIKGQPANRAWTLEDPNGWLLGASENVTLCGACVEWIQGQALAGVLSAWVEAQLPTMAKDETAATAPAPAHPPRPPAPKPAPANVIITEGTQRVIRRGGAE